ncbi:hypothetical protein WA158_008300 [Blastocystis sp. Blastoise]
MNPISRPQTSIPITSSQQATKNSLFECVQKILKLTYALSTDANKSIDTENQKHINFLLETYSKTLVTLSKINIDPSIEVPVSLLKHLDLKTNNHPDLYIKECLNEVREMNEVNNTRLQLYQTFSESFTKDLQSVLNILEEAENNNQMEESENNDQMEEAENNNQKEEPQESMDIDQFYTK